MSKHVIACIDSARLMRKWIVKVDMPNSLNAPALDHAHSRDEQSFWTAFVSRAMADVDFTNKVHEDHQK